MGVWGLRPQRVEGRALALLPLPYGASTSLVSNSAGEVISRISTSSLWRISRCLTRGGLEDGAAGFEADEACVFVFEFDPAFEDVDELEVQLVQVPLRLGVGVGDGADDVGAEFAFGGLGDAEVAVFEEGAQAAVEAGVFGVGDDGHGVGPLGRKILLFLKKKKQKDFIH